MKRFSKWAGTALAAVVLTFFSWGCAFKVNPDGTVTLKIHTLDMVITATGLEDALSQVEAAIQDCLNSQIDPYQHGDSGKPCTGLGLAELRHVQYNILRVKANLGGSDVWGWRADSDVDNFEIGR